MQALRASQVKREDFETKAIDGHKELQDLEVKRILHLKTIFCDVAYSNVALLPEMQQVGCCLLGLARRFANVVVYFPHFQSFHNCQALCDAMDTTETIAATCEARFDYEPRRF